MNINVNDICKKLYYRMLDINVGSENGEDLFEDAENGLEVVMEAKIYLNDYKNKIITKNELKERLGNITIQNNIRDIKDPFVNEEEKLNKQLWWLFDDKYFDEFLNQSWECEMNLDIMKRRSYNDNMEDFNDL